MEDLGEERSRHRLRAAPIVWLFAATAVGGLCLAMLHPVAAAVALAPLGLLVWLLINRGRDRLTVYTDGFAFRHRGKVWRCRWDDVDRVEFQLGDDRRARIQSVTRRDRERVTFGRFMGGLDVLYHAHLTKGGRVTPAVPARNDAGIGALLSTHGARRSRGCLPAVFVAGFLVLVALALVYVSADARDVWIAVGCTAAALGFVALLLWLALADRNDELRIHEHGFAYRRRGTVQECRWDEIADYEQLRSRLVAVMREDGTWISLSSDVPAVEEFVTPHVRITQDLSPP
jgi:hypothetical protein